MVTKKELIKVINMLRDALIWTTGSADFGKGGKAFKGANKVLYPAIKQGKRILDSINTDGESWKIVQND